MCPLHALFLHLLDEEDPAKDSEVLGLAEPQTEGSWVPESPLARQPPGSSRIPVWTLCEKSPSFWGQLLQ